MKDAIFGRYNASIIDMVINKKISAKEYLVWCYINLHCGESDGKQNPYKRGQSDLIRKFKLSRSRVSDILSSLTKAQLIRTEYRLYDRKNKKILKSKDFKLLWNKAMGPDYRMLRAYYYTKQ